jgi:hypothetical protein
MARLPSFEDLGRASAPGGRRMADADVTSGAQQILTGSAGLPGKGLAALGKGVASVGQSLGYIAAEREAAAQKLNEAWADTNLFVATSRLDEELKKQRDLNAISGFGDKYREAFDGIANGIEDEQQRELWKAKSEKLLAAKSIEVNDHALRVKRDNFRGGLGVTLQEGMGATLKSGDFGAGLSNVGRLLDGAVENGYMTAEEAGEAKNKWARSLAVNWIGSQTPEQRLAVLKPIDTGAASRKIYDKFAAAGFTPEQAAGAAGAFVGESRLDPNAVNPGDGRDGSDSIGIGQWNSDRAKALKAFAAARGKPWNDLDTQIDFAIQEMQTNEAKAGGLLKSAKTVDEAAAAMLHYERPKGYEGGLDVAAGGRERLRAARSIHGQFAAGGSAPDTRLAALLPPDVALRLTEDAQRDLIVQDRQQQQALKGEQLTVKSLVADDLASIVATGKGVDGLTPMRVSGALGPERAAAFEQERAIAKDYYAQTNDMLSLPSDQVERRVEALRPSPGAPGFATRQEYFEKAAKAAREIVEQRIKDPAAAADRLDFLKPVAEQATLEDPESYRPLVNARMAAQEGLGIAESARLPITKAEAMELWSTVRYAPEDRKPEAVKEVVRTVDAAFGEHSGAALGAMLRFARVDQATREQAAVVLKRLARDEAATVHDARALDQAQAIDASEKAVQGVLPSEEDIPEAAVIKRMNAPRFPLPSDRAIELLKSDPSKAGQFDQKFGPGASKKVLSLNGR